MLVIKNVQLIRPPGLKKSGLNDKLVLVVKPNHIKNSSLNWN